MVEIPDDARSAAALAVGPWADPRGELVSRVSQAILAERKRCAAVARAYLSDLEGCDMREDEPLLISSAIMDPNWKPPNP